MRTDRGTAPVWLLVAVGTLVGGAATGIVLQTTGAVDVVEEPAVAVAPYAETSFYDCPDGAAVGTLVRGDRVYLIGRDDAGGWVQVRSPRNLDERVWLPADQVGPDAAFELPVATCAQEVEVIAADTVPDTTVPDTTVPGPTVPGPGTTAPASAPTISQLSASPSTIWEAYAADVSTCQDNPGEPIQATVSAVVNGASTVTLRWSVGGVNGSKPMTLSGGTYRATLGRFGVESPNVVPDGLGSTRPITVTVEAVSAGGKKSTAQTTVTLKDCTFG